MSRSALEVADIFRSHGPAYRAHEAGHLSLGQFRVMSAIEACRTAALGGHVTQSQCAWRSRYAASMEVRSAADNGTGIVPTGVARERNATPVQKTLNTVINNFIGKAR